MHDIAAFSSAYRQYSRPLSRVSVQITNNSADAEDVAQEAWIVAWRHWAKIDQARIFVWLKAIARRCWWQMLHRRKSAGVRVTEPLMVAFDAQAHDSAGEGHLNSERKAEADWLYRSIDRMTNGNRNATQAMKQTTRVYAQTGSKAETARIRGITETGARAILDRAIGALRQQWGLV